MAAFRFLFEPIRIGDMEIPNRICHVPTDISSSHVNGEVSSRDIYHHETIARGGSQAGAATRAIATIGSRARRATLQ